MAGDSLNIQVDASGNAVAELKRVQKAMRANEAALKKLTNQGEKSSTVFARQRTAFAEISGSLGKLRSKALQAAAGLTAVIFAGKQLFDMAKAGAAAADQYAALTDRIEDFAGVVGSSRIATAGMINEKDLQNAAASFDAFGLDITQLDEALAEAAKTAVRTGKSASDMVDSLSVGIARMSAPILDNLGIQLKMSKVVERATLEFGKEAKALTDAEKKATLLKMSLEQLSEANKDIDLDSTLTVQLGRFEAKIDDTITKLSEWIALGWADVLGAGVPPLMELQGAVSESAEDLEGLSKAINNLNDSASWDIGFDLGLLISDQSQAARDLGKALGQLPQQMRLDTWQSLQSTLTSIPPNLRSMVAEMAGIPAAIAAITRQAEDLLKVATPAEAWWSGQLDAMFAEPKKAKKPKRRGGGGGGAKAARKAAQSAADALLKTSMRQREMADAVGEFDRAKIKHAHEVADALAKINELEAKGVSQSKIQALLDSEGARLSEKWFDIKFAMFEGQDEADAKQAKARRLALAETAEIVALSEIDVAILRARGPLEQAELQLTRAKMEAKHALASLSKDENEAMKQRAEIQARLNMAQEQYNQLVRETMALDLGEQLRGVSAAASKVQGALSAVGDTSVGEALGGITQAVGTSADAWSSYAEGTTDVGSALAGTAGAVGAAAMSFMDDEREKAAVAAAMQAAHAIAAYASLNIPAGIAHTAAAAAFTAIAAGAGSVGGGGGAASGGGSGAQSGAGFDAGPGSAGGFAGADSGRQVIVQFGSGVILGSAQEVSKAVNQAAFAARNTGAQAGW